eukprot:4711288-Prorocentrum_lima.AAC.1
MRCRWHVEQGKQILLHSSVPSQIGPPPVNRGVRGMDMELTPKLDTSASNKAIDIFALPMCHQ